MRAIATITVAICSHIWLFSLGERGPQSLGLEKKLNLTQQNHAFANQKKCRAYYNTK